MKQTPTQVSSYTNLVWSSRSILSCTRNLNIRPVYASQIKKLRKRFFGGTSYVVGQFLHPSAVHVQSSRSIQHMQKVQLFLNTFFILRWQFGYGTSLCFTDQDTQKEIFGGTNSLVGQFLHPSPVQSSRSIQRIQTVQLFLHKFVFFFYLVLAIWMWDQSMLHRSRNSGRDFWWNQLPCGPVLTPISCTKVKIHSTYEDSTIVPKQVFFSLVLAIWNVGPVHASQIKKLRKRFLVEPAPLWASSYTHLLYKVQDPFHV